MHQEYLVQENKYWVNLTMNYISKLMPKIMYAVWNVQERASLRKSPKEIANSKADQRANGTNPFRTLGRDLLKS